MASHPPPELSGTQASPGDDDQALPQQVLPPGFDGLQYIASHDDLIPAFGLDAAAGQQHYLAFGEAEGRAVDTFDEQQYLARYPDLQAAFGADGAAATAHYVQFGFYEDRTDEELGPGPGPGPGPGNTPPTAQDDTGAATEDGGPVRLNVLANDTDPDPGDRLTIVAVDATAAVGDARVTPDGSRVVYNPGQEFQELGAGQTATDTFAYTMQDRAGAQSTATVTMTVAGADEPPPAMAALDFLF
jgi:VCBS repeat-containing protein